MLVRGPGNVKEATTGDCALRMLITAVNNDDAAIHQAGSSAAARLPDSHPVKSDVLQPL
jgi:hypothetical protein